MSTIPFHDHKSTPQSGTVQPFHDEPATGSSEDILTTVPITVGATTYQIGTPIQDVVNAIATTISPIDTDEVITTIPLTLSGVPISCE